MVKQILTTVFMCGVILITSPNIANANNVTVGNDNEQLKAVVKDFLMNMRILIAISRKRKS
mgnify:FL=1